MKLASRNPPKYPLTYNGLHHVTFQKIGLIMTTAVKNSNPTFIIFFTKATGLSPGPEKSNLKN
jgi:hypothetical protein